MWADALPNLLIGLREGLEAGLVVSILLAAVRRVDRSASTAPVWLGVSAAIVLALSFGAVLTFYRSILSTTGQEALGGVLSVIAVVLVTGMIFWMRETARHLSGELRAKVAEALGVSTAALVLTAFLAVGREGVETALFLWTTAQASGQTIAPLAGAAIGIAVAVVLCVLLYRSAVRIRLDRFFNRTAVLLIVIAAGVLAYGLGDLQDAGLLPGHTWLAFDLSHSIDPSSWWASIITGITELSPTMTWLQVIAYVGYLGTVLVVFARANPERASRPQEAQQADAEQAPVQPEPEPAPEQQASEEQPAELAARPRRRVATVAGVVAILVVPPVAAAALIAFAPGRSAASAQEIDVTPTSCAPGWSASSGTGQFNVVNKSGHTVEVNLVQAASQGIVAEIETLGPATQQSMSAAMPTGDYQWRCLIDGLPSTTSAAVHVTTTGSVAQAPPPVKPVTEDDLDPAGQAYDAYAAGKVNQLAGQVATIRTDLSAGDLDASRRDWLSAQLTWEQVGAAYDSFGDLGDAVDQLPQGLPGGVDDPDFTGLHRLEYGLWHGQPASELLPVADQLSSDVAKLQAKLPQITVDPTDLPTRAHEILEDALRDHLSGNDDQGAGAAYPETLADVQGTRVVLDELAPLLNPRSPHLVATAEAQLDTLQQALLATQLNGQWQSPNTTPQPQREAVNAAVGAVLETLSDVPDLLEVPAHGQ